MMKKPPVIFKITSILLLIFFMTAPFVVQAGEKPLNAKSHILESYWPIAPLDGEKEQKSIDLGEPLYKPSKKIWHDLPYTDTDIKVQALKGFMWMIRFMGSENHLKENEHNYLTMLATTFCSARDPYLRRMAREEAKTVAAKLIANRFISRYEEDDDVDSLLEYVTLFNNLAIDIPELKEKTIKMLEKEKKNIIDRIKKEKQASLDGDDLYDTMLLTYYITNLKNHFPDIALLNDLPDLGDFFEILSKYTYHLEDKDHPDFSKLTDEDIAAIMDDLYNITHAIFVISDYNAYKVPQSYFQREIHYMHKFYDLVCSKYHNDPDLLSEIVYVLSAMDYPQKHDAVKKGWIKMLHSQREDGSWEAFGVDKHEDATDKNYDIFHATWVAFDMIVEPVSLGTAPFYKPLVKSLENYGNAYKVKSLIKNNR
jgi:hypothetical protein